MTTREYLEQLLDIDDDILNISNQAQKWRDIAMKMGHPPNGERVDSSPKPDQMENAVIKAIECERKAGNEAERLIRLKEKIENQILGLKEEGRNGKTYYFLIWGYFHENKKMTELSRHADYSYNHAKRLFNKALSVFEKRYGDTYLKS